jgi:D-arabinose 1-dehydrogenase-like Zn-dependent alcohol dehydrogenase
MLGRSRNLLDRSGCSLQGTWGGLTGTPIDNEDTLAFSVLANIRPMIETVPLEHAAGAYARMMQGKARPTVRRRT